MMCQNNTVLERLRFKLDLIERKARTRLSQRHPLIIKFFTSRRMRGGLAEKAGILLSWVMSFVSFFYILCYPHTV